MYDVEEITENVTKPEGVRVYSVIHNMETYTVASKGNELELLEYKQGDDDDTAREILQKVKDFQDND